MADNAEQQHREIELGILSAELENRGYDVMGEMDEKGHYIIVRPKQNINKKTSDRGLKDE